MPPLFGVDVSVYQGTVDWPRMKREGFTFAIARTSIGKGIDSRWSANRQGIAAAGLVLGGYHFLFPGDPEGQADLYLRALGEPRGKILVVDVEKRPNGEHPTYWEARRFVAHLRSRVGAQPIVLYTGGWFWRGYLGNPDGAAFGVKLWSSRYVAGRGYASVLYERVPDLWWEPGYGGWDEATLLQFSSSGIAGGESPCDVNAFRGTKTELLALTRAPALPPPPPAPTVSYYLVRAGDTLYAIARRFGTTITALLRLNPQIVDPDLIYAGQRLRVR